MPDLLSNKLLVMRNDAIRHGREPDELLLLIHAKDYQELMREFGAGPTMTGKEFVKMFGIEVELHAQDAVPTAIVHKESMRRYTMQAVAAQFHGHPLEVEARRSSFEALVMPWVAYQKASGEVR